MTGFCSQHSSHSTEIASYGGDSAVKLRPVIYRRLKKGHLLWHIPAKLLACCSHRRCRQRSLLTSASIQPSSETVKASASLPALHARSEGFEEAHRFSSYANWIIPGHVMLGRYPYVEPSRCRTHEQGEEQLAQILNEGITTFLCLQGEIPPQSKMRIGGVRGFVPYAATASLLASAMGAPPGMQEVNGLRNRYLDTYLPPRRKQNRIESEPAREVISLQFLHQLITDLSIPTKEQVRSITGDIKRRLEAGEKIYMHCWGGRGRAGTLGACLLGDLYGIDAEEALLRVQKAFDSRGDAGYGYGSPETLQQIDFVKQYLGRS